MSADTDRLDAFVDHGSGLELPLRAAYENLARQRNYLLGLGLPQVVVNSEVATLENTLQFMTDLDRFVGDISSSLQLMGEDLGHGVFRAPVRHIEARLGRTDDRRLDDLEAALRAEGISGGDARRLREQVELLLEADPRFEIDGATVSEPADLAEALVANINDRAGRLVDTNQVRSSELHAEPRLSVEKLAADLYFGNHIDGLVSYQLLDGELRSLLTDDQYSDLQKQLALLEQRERFANASLLGASPGAVEIDDDLDGLAAQAQDLYEGSQVGAPYGGAPRLDEPEIGYQLQRLAEEDPGRALTMKWLLDGIMTPHERAELDRILATNGTFGERAGLATAHPVDGATGAVKGAWNDNFGWLMDGWADAEVAITHGFYGMATGSVPGRSSEVDRVIPQVPATWEENESIIELEFTMDNLAEQGGADIAFAIELASAAYGGGKGGLSVVRVGRRYFLRNGDDIVASLGPRLANQLDETADLALISQRTPIGPEPIRPLGRGSTVNNVDRFHPRTLRERLAIEEVMQNPSAGHPAAGRMRDSRWPGTDGWKKLQQTVEPGGGEGPVTLHYNYNPLTGDVDDFKVIARKPYVPDPEPFVPRGGRS